MKFSKNFARGASARNRRNVVIGPLPTVLFKNQYTDWLVIERECASTSLSNFLRSKMGSQFGMARRDRLDTDSNQIGGLNS